MSSLECIVEAQDILGEGPFWSPDEASLYWFDIMQNRLSRVNPATSQYASWRLSSKCHGGAFCEGGGMIVTAHAGVCFYDIQKNELTTIYPAESHTHFNDVKCDRRGRFWFGSVPKKIGEPTGSLFRVDPDLTVRVMQPNAIASNGIGWSPDQKTMYFADTYGGGIFAYDFDLDSGEIDNRRLLIPREDGLPDGLTVDAEGCIWCAYALSGAVYRFTPQGKIDRRVDVPAKFTTSCIFGGKDLDTLFITTARAGRPKEELEQLPLSGALFAIQPGVRGMPEPKFAGGPSAVSAR